MTTGESDAGGQCAGNFLLNVWGLPFSMYALRGRGGGVKSAIHFHCVLHAKRGEGVQIACKIAYVLNGKPLLERVVF